MKLVYVILNLLDLCKNLIFPNLYHHVFKFIAYSTFSGEHFRQVYIVKGFHVSEVRHIILLYG